MTSLYRYPALIALTFGLSSCDSIKNKLVAILDEKIEETGGDSAAATTAGTDEFGDEVTPPPGLPGVEQPTRKISDSDYDAFTKISGHVVVVDFYADWCGPCKRLSPILESIVEDNRGKVLLGKMDVDKNKKVPSREGVRGIPDVRIYVNGAEVDRFVGLMPEQVVRQKIEAHLGKVSGSAPKPAPKPKPVPKPPAPTKPETKQPETDPKTQDPKDPEQDPKIKRMDKDWLPPGIQRKGT